MSLAGNWMRDDSQTPNPRRLRQLGRVHGGTHIEDPVRPSWVATIPGPLGILLPMNEQHYPEASQAVVVLVLGILSLVLCQVLGPVAWVMGNSELASIDAGRRPPENRGLAMAGKVIGIVATVLLVGGIGVFLLFMIVAPLMASFSH